MVWCMAAIGGLSFVSVFLFGLPSGFHPSVPAASVVLFVVAGGGVCAYWWQWQKIHSGDDDLIIDEGSRTMELPETYGRKNRVTVALAGVENLTVEVIEHHGSKGGTSYTYAPTLWLRDGDAGSQKLADWSDKMKAEAFTDWLRKRLGVSNVPPIRTTMRTGTGSDPLRRSNG